MEWIVCDQYSHLRIDDAVVANFKETLRNSEIDCKVVLQLVKHDFWNDANVCLPGLEGPTAEFGCVGSVGYEGPGCDGPSGPTTHVDDRKIANAEDVTVNIAFTMPNKQAKELERQKLEVSLNKRGESLPTWKVTKRTKQYPYCCGIYKKPGFDEAFKAIKALKSSLTEQTFARDEWNSNSGWDEELVSLELFHGWDNCLSTMTMYETSETGKSDVILSLLAIDVEPNMSYIMTLLSPFK